MDLRPAVVYTDDNAMAETAKDKPSTKSEPKSRQTSEFDNFSRALKQIVSVSKADIDLHEPIRPRSNGADNPDKSKS